MTRPAIPIIDARHEAAAQPTRRALLQWLAASTALATGACSRAPASRIYSHDAMPEIEAQGVPQFYASACTRGGGYAQGVLVGTQQGRPIKVEGNPQHPASLGGTSVFGQAAILQLWDPDRSTAVWQRGADGRAVPSTWPAFASAWAARPADQALHVLTPAFTSPSLAAQLAALLKKRLGSRWYRDDAAPALAARHGAELAFGRELCAVHDFAAPELIVAIGGDPFSDPATGLRHSADWARARSAALAAGRAPARLLALETTPGLFGARADERWALPPVMQERVLWRAAASLLPGLPPVGADGDDPVATRLVALLSRHRGRLLLWAGPELSAPSQALVHALNHVLAGGAVAWIDPPDLHRAALPAPGTLAELADAALRGDVQTLLVLGSNPAYAAPAALRFEAALARVPLSLHTGTYRDETAQSCHWHLPAGHEFEQWSDARAFDGTLSLMQPVIAPLYDTRSPQELLALLGGEAAPDGHRLLRAHWQQARGALNDFDEFWRASLRRGIVADSASAPVSVSTARVPTSPIFGPAADDKATLWAVFPPDASVGDGEHANNGWLQELPRPFTQIAWGNALQLGPQTAAALGLASGDLVRASTAEGASVDGMPVWVQPGHAEGAATLPNGFGRRAAGRVGDGVGVDNAALRSATQVAIPLTLKRSGAGHHRFALTQVEMQQHGRELARTMPVEPEPQHATLYEAMPSSGPAWGMAIDLDACIGCNVCTIACQAENNIPVVGPEEVRHGRAMHWIRVDAYRDEGTQRTITQPVACMHCENAPCELVCPVGATMHDSEGLNVQVYNRCVGTRFCSNNCPYKVRRFNFRQYNDLKTETLKLMRNPDVTVRDRGVMEKCSYCVQRLSRARRTEQRTGEPLPRDAVQTACQSACPTGAIHFGDLNDAQSDVSLAKASPRHYAMLGELNTRPRTTYLARQAPLPKEDA